MMLLLAQIFSNTSFTLENIFDYSWVQVQGTPVQGTFGLKRRKLYTLD